MARYTNECGCFVCDQNGILQQYIPCDGNMVNLWDKDASDGKMAVTNMIIPENITGFVNEFFRFAVVTNTFKLPDSLRSIGTCDRSSGSPACVFANCNLPDVILPEGLYEIGTFAFGKCEIKSLRIPYNLRSPYARQFKDSHIGTLLLPAIYRDGDVSGGNADSVQMLRNGNMDGPLGFLGNFKWHVRIDHIHWY